jgi:hypothetical protein
LIRFQISKYHYKGNKCKLGEEDKKKGDCSRHKPRKEHEKESDGNKCEPR